MTLVPSPGRADGGAVLAVYLIDLRAQYEAELRTLTSTQRAVEQFRTRTSDDARRQCKIEIRRELRVLGAANAAVRDALTEAIRRADVLEPAFG